MHEYESIRLIYRTMVDEKSRDVFCKRFRYNLENGFNSVGALHALVMTNDRIRRFIERAVLYDKVLIYGAGIRGRSLKKLFPEIHVKGFLETRPKDKSCDDLPVLDARSYIARNKEEYYIISSRGRSGEEMRQILKAGGIENDHILDWGLLDDLNERDQYFDVFCDRKWSKEIFVDMGCYDGETSIRLSELAKEELEKVIAFEPDPDQLKICENHMNSTGIHFDMIAKGA